MTAPSKLTTVITKRLKPMSGKNLKAIQAVNGDTIEVKMKNSRVEET